MVSAARPAQKAVIFGENSDFQSSFRQGFPKKMGNSAFAVSSLEKCEVLLKIS
jgi:hypothetical protein